MPPKKESKPKPKQKTARDGTPAAHEGDEASVMASPKKRARTDSLNKPIPPLPFGKYPSEHGLLLNTLINNAPLAHYANLQAVKLFNEATDFDLFKAASFVFWNAWFAVTRGCSARFLGPLLHQVMSSTSGTPVRFFAANVNDCLVIWKNIYNRVKDVFCKRVLEYVQAWADSPAGKQLVVAIGIARHNNQKMHQVTADDLEAFVYENKEYPGCPLNIQVVSHIFREIIECCEVVHYIENDYVWFREGEGILPYDEVSWSSRWISVMKAVLPNVIDKYVKDQGRNKHWLQPAFVEGLLYPVSTPALQDPDNSDIKIMPQLPIRDIALTEWVRLLSEQSKIAELYDLRFTNAPEEPIEVALEEDNPESWDEKGIPLEFCEKAFDAQEEVDKRLQEVVEKKTAPILAKTYSTEQLKSFTVVPIAEVKPLASKFAEEMTQFNVWGQTNIMIARLQEQKGHYSALAASALAGVEAADKRIATLKAERDSLRKAEKYLQRISQKFNVKSCEEDDLQKEVDVLKRRPGVMRVASGVKGFAKSPTVAPSQSISEDIPITEDHVDLEFGGYADYINESESDSDDSGSAKTREEEPEEENKDEKMENIELDERERARREILGLLPGDD